MEEISRIYCRTMVFIRVLPSWMSNTSSKGICNSGHGCLSELVPHGSPVNGFLTQARGLLQRYSGYNGYTFMPNNGQITVK